MLLESTPTEPIPVGRLAVDGQIGCSCQVWKREVCSQVPKVLGGCCSRRGTPAASLFVLGCWPTSGHRPIRARRALERSVGRSVVSLGAHDRTLAPAKHQRLHGRGLERPTMHRGVIDEHTAFNHPLFDVSKAARVRSVPTHAHRHHFERAMHPLEALAAALRSSSTGQTSSAELITCAIATEPAHRRARSS